MQRQLQELLDLKAAPSEADARMLRSLGIESPDSFPAGPAPEKDPDFVPEANRSKPGRETLLPFNWCTGVVLLAFFLLTLLGSAITVSFLDSRTADPREISASRYFQP